MDYDTASRYYEELLSGYLRATPAAGLDETVARFVAPMRSAFVDDQAEESAIDTIEGLLWAAWEPVITAARESSSGTVQDRLVDLLTGIERQGVLTRDQGQQDCVVWETKVFVDLPCFGAQMREALDMGAETPGFSDVDVWVNLNAFAARLTAAGIDFSLYAIWTLRDCLEEESPVNLADPRGVVPWFQHCGALLAGLARRRRSFDGQAGRLGKLCTDSGMAEGGFTVERWEFWRARLTELAAGTEAGADEARAALRYLGT
ncbi:hypothetical protein ABH930_002382 [Kitasatospora sp. GAS204A]|uniref:DUF3632 domain-containing protein n=1 Tax=unclassified Kitasatospora TaxID=2633591 RepID=UPI0024768BC6|nr:DUF3632 domain-containing protein [Kitasatospora sp. GAS204B]MDH6121613.1 hypothetical protein [Kitasatospora sp. GAS204B]